MNPVRTLVLPLVALIALAATAVAQDAPELSERTVDRVREYVLPRQTDLVHRRIEWTERLVEGIAEAQRRDRPIFAWLYFGGPLGAC